MAKFKTVSGSHFNLDGVLYPKNYDVSIDNTTILLFNIYSEKWFDRSFEISDITIDDRVLADFASKKLFINELKKTVFKKGGADGEGSGKTYIQTFKTTKTFGNGNAALLNLFPEVSIQANKKVRLDIYVPTRDGTTSWGGLYVNVNAKVNNIWYNLGNTGYDGGVMANSANTIHALNHEMLLDFVGNLNLDSKLPFTLQFELTARSYNGTTTVNGSHDINKTGNNLGARGTLQTWASDQNYTHLIITEKDR